MLKLRLPDIAADQLSPQNRLNRYFGAGWGQFTNGFLFDSEFDGDLALLSMMSASTSIITYAGRLTRPAYIF